MVTKVYHISYMIYGIHLSLYFVQLVSKVIMRAQEGFKNPYLK